MASEPRTEYLYHYKAQVVGVYDGDTIYVDIDLGLSTWIRHEKIRLARIDAPEIRGKERPAGVQAREFLKKLVLNKSILLVTIKDRREKYGRYLGEIWLEENGEWINVNDRMLEAGMAEPYRRK